MKSWIYRLNKTQAICEAEKWNLNTSGTLDDIRRRLSRYIDKHPAMPETEPKAAMPGEGMGLRSTSRLQIPPPSPLPPPPPEPAESHTAHEKCMNQIRKWGCHFDGRDPLPLSSNAWPNFNDSTVTPTKSCVTSERQIFLFFLS